MGHYFIIIICTVGLWSANTFQLRQVMPRLALGKMQEGSPTETGELTTRERVEAIVARCSARENLTVHHVTWAPGRIEVILREDLGISTDEVVGPSIDSINAVHRRLTEVMELDPEMDTILRKNEVLLASPGVGEHLYRDIDFTVFKGFPVTITTTEVYKKKTSFEGTLIDRTDEHVSVSLKGRIIKVPRKLIEKVSLPTPKFEDNDEEMRKLR